MPEDKIAPLARAVRDAVEKYKSENRIKLSKRIFIRRCDMELRYVDDVGLGRFPHQRIEEDVWDLADLQAFFSTVLMALDEYRSLVAALAETKSGSAPSIGNFALRSRMGFIETGLPLCPPEKKARKLACKSGGTFSLVPIEGESRVIAAISSDSQRNAAGFLCIPDCLAEGEGFEPPVPFRVQQFSRLPV